jgi:hypothetical protein
MTILRLVCSNLNYGLHLPNYKRTDGDVAVPLLLMPVDTYKLNVVHFIWNWFDIFDFHKYARLVFSPNSRQILYR